MLLTLEDNYGLNLTIPSRLQTFLYIGKPVIASINGEAQKIINAANAEYVDANDKAGLIRAIVDFKAKKEVDLIDYQKMPLIFMRTISQKSKFYQYGKRIKILILGISGMLGHQVYKYLDNEKIYELSGVGKKKVF